VPNARTLPVLQEAVQDCRGCDLYQHATQAVFGELETGAKAEKPKVAIMMIGDQPGDQENKQGRPFVGPAGKLLDRCLEEAGNPWCASFSGATTAHGDGRGEL
jgi:uracil-DNA glycosylase